MKYSIWTGLKKGLLSLLPISVGVLTLVGMSDMTVWELLEQHVKPFVGSITVGGAVTMLINYLKFKLSQEVVEELDDFSQFRR